MKLGTIKESGSNNTLLWAIKNGADVISDQELQSIINDEMFYIVTFNDVNFFELFRLTQLYRNKIRILSEQKADIPTMEFLASMFPGSFQSEDKNNIPLCEIAEHSLTEFFNLVFQMESDSDIIKMNTLRMFLPMITRRFDVQIPINFIDIVGCLGEEESKEFFTRDYPDTIDKVLDKENNSIEVNMKLGFIRSTSINRYGSRYDQYLRFTKYFPLKQDGNKLYKIALLGFHKFNPITRGENRCNMFNVNPNQLSNEMRKISKINSDLMVDVVVQMPIQYMQELEYTFSNDDLRIDYESSMVDIIQNGFQFNDFITYEINEDSSDEDKAKYDAHINGIESYKVRIAEANTRMFNGLSIILNSEDDIDERSAFALLPSIYMTNAVMTLNMNKKEIYRSSTDGMISEIMKEAITIGEKVIADLNSMK